MQLQNDTSQVHSKEPRPWQNCRSIEYILGIVRKQNSFTRNVTFESHLVPVSSLCIKVCFHMLHDTFFIECNFSIAHLQQALPTLPSYVVGLFSFGIPFHSVAANSVTLLRLQLTKKKNGTLEPHYSKVPQYRKKKCSL